MPQGRIPNQRPHNRARSPQQWPNGRGVTVLELVREGRPVPEILKCTDWQPHSLRGFLSTASKKLGLKFERTRENGVTTYRIVNRL